MKACLTCPQAGSRGTGVYKSADDWKKASKVGRTQRLNMDLRSISQQPTETITRHLMARSSGTGRPMSNAANITGIRRDDGSALNQKQSKSINTTGLLTIQRNGYTAGAFPTTNTVNTNTFLPIRLLLIGDNRTAGSVCNGKMRQIQRVWKVNKTGSLELQSRFPEPGIASSTIKYLIVSPRQVRGNTSFYPLSGRKPVV